MSKSEFPQYVRDSIGTIVTYSYKKKQVTGMILGVRWSSAEIIDMETDEITPGIHFLMEDEKGKSFWTKPFPCREQPISQDSK